MNDGFVITSQETESNNNNRLITISVTRTKKKNTMSYAYISCFNIHVDTFERGCIHRVLIKNLPYEYTCNKIN